MRIQCVLHSTRLHVRSASNSSALFRREALIPEADSAVPEKHAAAIESPDGIFSRRLGDVFSGSVVFSGEEQAELARVDPRRISTGVLAVDKAKEKSYTHSTN